MLTLNKPYKHIYGGNAIDREVTAERFAAVLETTTTTVAALNPNDGKQYDRPFRHNETSYEVLGYVYLEPRFAGAPAARRYVLTVINHGPRPTLRSENASSPRLTIGRRG